MESGEQIQTLPGFGGDAEIERLGKPRGIGEDRSRLLDQLAVQGLRILKETTRGGLPNGVDQLSPTTRRQLRDLSQQSVAGWKAFQEES